MPPSPSELAALLYAAAELLRTAASQTPAAAPTTPQLITLDQCAALVRRKKKTLYCYLDTMPAAVNRPRPRGQALLYDWQQMRPWLQKTFGISLPERCPGY
jgi:hypothetical protein